MIRKTILLVTGTVAGVVGVVGYNPPQLDAAIAPTSDSVAPASDSITPSASASPSSATPTNTNTSTKTEAKASTTKATTQTAAAKATTSPIATKSAGSSGTFQGDTSYTRWAPVQVEITVADGKVTNVSTLQYPSGDRKSMNISNQVLPWLQQEALRAQSANITGISGATYTSTGFITSLASALQKAGI